MIKQWRKNIQLNQPRFRVGSRDVEDADRSKLVILLTLIHMLLEHLHLRETISAVASQSFATSPMSKSNFCSAVDISID